MTVINELASAEARQDVTTRKARPRSWMTIPAIIAVCATLPLFMTSAYDINVLTLILIYAIAAYGVDLVLGHLGLVSVAHAALLSIGAYTLAILTTMHHTAYWWAAGASVVTTALAGLVLAGLTMRSRGHYFAVGSLAFAVVTVVILTQWQSLTRGANGIYAIPSPPKFESQKSLYFLSVIALAVTLILVYWLTQSTLGRNMRTIRTDEMLAASLGINIVWTKLKAFTISAAIVGIAGPLYASWVSYITPQSANITHGFNFLIYAIIGGSGTLAGPLVGAGLVVGVTEALRFTDLYQTLIFSGVVFLVLLFFRGGVVGNVSRAWNWAMRRGRFSTGSDVVTSGTGGVAIETAPSSEQQKQTVPGWPLAQHPVGVPIFEGRRLTKEFGGVCAVRDVSLIARSGEITGVIGPNGAGKSTLFGVISGVVGGWSGEACFDGRELGKLPAHRRARLGIARTFQTNRLLVGETVLDNLITASYLHRRAQTNGRQSSEANDYLQNILELTGLRSRARVPVSNLSLEEQKLVGVGMALAVRPRMLLLDEPFAGLRESETQRLTQVLRSLRDGGLAILLVEHKMRILMALCSHVYVLESGALIADGSPQEIAKDPQVITAYLGTRSA